MLTSVTGFTLELLLKLCIHMAYCSLKEASNLAIHYTSNDTMISDGSYNLSLLGQLCSQSLILLLNTVSL